jgi:hypothetical protein
LLAVVMVVSGFFLTTASSASGAWVPSSIGKSFYENTDNGNIQMWENMEEGGHDPKFVKEWTPSEWEAWKNEVNGIAKGYEENTSKIGELVDKIIADTPGITEGEADDAAGVLTNAREAGAGLDESVTGAIDSVASDAGGALTFGQVAGMAGTGLGAVLLGPSAFKVGVDIGNGLDEFFGIPTWEVFKKEAVEHPVPESWPDFEHPLVQWVAEGGGERDGLSFSYPAGWYATCINTPPVLTGFYEIYHGVEKGQKGCPGGAVVGSAENPPESGKVNFVELLRLCLAATAAVFCDAGSPGGAHPQGIARPGGLGTLVEKSNEEAGLAPVPKTSTELKSGPHPGKVSRKQFGKALEEGVEPGKPSEEELKSNEHKPAELEHAPVPHYLEEESPHLKEKESEHEPPAEPEVKVGEIIEPGFHQPNFGVACTSFPFGVPCWVVKVVESWSATGSAPEWTFPWGAGKSYPITVKLSVMEPAMEIVRPVIFVSFIVGIVMLFFKFALGGGGDSMSGGDD